MKSVLLDTNVLSALFRGDKGVNTRLSQYDRLVISPVVEGELLGGFRAGTRLEQNLALWADFLNESFVVRVTLGAETADRYSRIWMQLQAKGTPIPSNDIWIAAHATEMGTELVSFDRHFEMVDGLVWSLLGGAGHQQELLIFPNLEAFLQHKLSQCVAGGHIAVSGFPAMDADHYQLLPQGICQVLKDALYFYLWSLSQSTRAYAQQKKGYQQGL